MNLKKTCGEFKRKWMVGVCLCGMFMILFAKNAWAEDWVWKINVPVEVNEMLKEAKEIYIRVFIFGKNHVVSLAAAQQTKELDSDGSINGPIIFEFEFYEEDIAEGFYPGEATEYQAIITVRGIPDVKEQGHYLPLEYFWGLTSDYHPIWSQTKPGAELITIVSGPLNKIIEFNKKIDLNL